MSTTSAAICTHTSEAATVVLSVYAVCTTLTILVLVLVLVYLRFRTRITTITRCASMHYHTYYIQVRISFTNSMAGEAVQFDNIIKLSMGVRKRGAQLSTDKMAVTQNEAYLSHYSSYIEESQEGDYEYVQH